MAPNYEEDPGFATRKLAAFGDINFKLVIKEQKTQKEPLTFPLFCLRDAEGNCIFRKKTKDVHFSLI